MPTSSPSSRSAGRPAAIPPELYVAPPEGDGEPLVLVHGGWTDHGTWAALVPHLVPSFRVLRYDRRGHSRSPRGRAVPTRRRHEDDLASLLEQLGGGPAHLAGTSYGAAIALALAGRRPELVRSVVAHEPPLVGLVGVSGIEELFAGIAGQIAAGDVAGGTQRFFEEAALGPGGWQRVPEPMRQASMANARTFTDMLQDPAWGQLDAAAVARFPGPVLVTYGDAGPAWLPEVARAVAARIGLPARLIAGAGHTPHHTHPEALASQIAAVARASAARRAA